jgi:LemA protein
MDPVIWILLGIVVVFLGLFVLVFNSLVVLRNRIDNAWAQIDVQTKKRYDLVPNLVETVKGYAKHEKAVFTEVTRARTAMMKAGSLAEKAKAQDALTGALKSLFAVAENYPQLRASENFLMLQEELSGIEGKIAYARQFYNDSVLSFNNRIQTFPTSIVANMFHYKPREYYGIESAARKAVKVSF